MKHSIDDTIAAIVTPPGVGGVGVVRFSGDQAVRILSEIIEDFPLTVAPRYIYHAWVKSGSKRIDEVLFFYMNSPNSYTGEDVAEISCHGGIHVQKQILRLIVDHGARLAERGEFTLRAFLNGKIDLPQAEAVLDVIGAKSDEAAASAVSQLEGQFSRTIMSKRQLLLDLLVKVEAGLDFPDDLAGHLTLEDVASLDNIREEIGKLISSAGRGKLLRQGLRLAIIGKPNVGKSSLFNALACYDRAIVSGMPGTTRDTIEETLVLGGLPVVAVDTAGIRPAGDEVEGLGISRARVEAVKADMVLLMFDASQPLSDDDKAVLRLVDKSKTIVVLNKIDLGNLIGLNGEAKNLVQVKTSAKLGFGLEDLIKAIVDKLLAGGPSADLEYFINERQSKSLSVAYHALTRLISQINDNKGPECLAFGLKEAIAALGQVSGEEVSNEVIGEIFGRFCVGK